MAKTQGGNGLEEGMLNLDQVAMLINFVTNENKGRGTDEYMNFLVSKLKKEIEERHISEQAEQAVVAPLPKEPFVVESTTTETTADEKLFTHDYEDEE